MIAMTLLPRAQRTSLSQALIGSLVAMSCTAAAAGDAEAGRLKSQMCTVCHGPLGLSSAPDVPNIAGQPEIYLTAQLRGYRSGSRRHEVMGVIAKTLADDDIANLAAWFASIRVEAQPPR